jgi:hypothetical protein
MADNPAMESQPLSVEERMMANLDLPDEEVQEAVEPEAEATEVEPEEAIEESGAETEEETAEPAEVINIDGEEYEVPAPLKDAFMREQDYRKKTMELATQRKMLDEQIQVTQQQAQFQQQFNEQIGVISNIDAQIKQYEGVNWDVLQQDDPLQFVALKEKLRDLKDARNYYTNDLNQKQQQNAIQAQQHYAKLKEQGVRDLQNSIKGWGEERAREIKSFGVETYGFQETELASIIDPRMVKVLHDAYLYRKGASVSNKKIIGKPQIGKPKAQVSQAKENTVKLRQALKKTGDKQYAARAIEALL